MGIEDFLLKIRANFRYITPYPKIWVYTTRTELGVPISNILFKS